MLPYLIAGVIGYGISKLFDDKKAPKYVDGGLIAPNGKPSNLTPEQYKLVRTPAFKKWFGDWENDPANASKVVDSNGEPLPVYHGTTKEFTIFNKKELGTGTKATLGYLGFFFTDDKSLAIDFTRKKWISPKSKLKEGSKVIDAFLNIRNPKYMSIDEYIIVDNNNRDSESIIKYQKKLVRQGFDGVIVEKAQMYWQSKMREFDGKQYVAFEPNQIKLADGTNTTFDGINPDIRFMAGGKLADNIFDYLIKEKGFAPLGKGFWGKSNCTIKIDFSNVLYQQNGDNRVWLSPIEYSDYKKAFTILEFHCKDKNKGIGTALLKEIIQGADLFGYTIFIEPTSMKKYRVETDINTNDLKQWYSKYDFKPINDNYSDNVWLRNPNNPDIRFMAGGNIDDVLDKMLQGEELSQEDKNKISLYQKHLFSGKNDNTFEYHRVSELNIADTNSEEHINKSQIVVQFESDQKIDVKYMLKKIALTLKKSNIDSVVGFGFKMLAYIGYFVKVNEYDIEKAMSVLKNIGFNVTINPYYNTLYFSNEIKDDIKFRKLSENPDIIILSNSEIYQKLNLTDEQFNTRLTKLLKNFGITSYFIMKNQITITDKSKINDLINYLNNKGYNAIRFKKRK